MRGFQCHVTERKCKRFLEVDMMRKRGEAEARAKAGKGAEMYLLNDILTYHCLSSLRNGIRQARAG